MIEDRRAMAVGRRRAVRLTVTIAAAAALLQATISAFAQAAPTTLPQHKPTLKRDRTQRTLYPKIVQYEDERTITSDLLEMITSSHGGAKRRAIMALGRIGYPSGITPLIALLNSGGKVDDHNAGFRALAAFALGEVEHQYSAAVLLDHLNPEIERSLLVRARCAEALGKIGSNKLSAAALGQYGISGIASTIADRLPAVTQTHSKDDELYVSLSLTALLRLKQASTVPAIASQLNSPDAEIRWQAANALARIRDAIANAVPALLPLLGDENELVRAHAARALGVARARPAVDPLVNLVADKDQRVVASAINALGAIADPRAVEPLIALGGKLLEGYKSSNRERYGVPVEQNQLLLIATTLGQIRDSRSLPFLKSLRAACAPYGAQPEIEIAVARFGDEAYFDTTDDPGKLSGTWKGVAAYAQGLGQLASDRARVALNALFSHAAASKPYTFALPDLLKALAAARCDGLREILLNELKSDDVIVRATAATLLGDQGVGPDDVVRALDSAYRTARADKVNDVRIAVLESLEKLKHPLSVQVLAEDTRDPDYVVRLRASEFLRESKHEVTTRLEIGRVETGHDKAYWHRIARLSESSRNPVAVVRTMKGDIRIELLADDAPMTVDNFIQLAKRGFYNRLSFHRVVPTFVIQGGDPRDDGNGGPGYQIRDEINLERYTTGTVGMALSGRDTGGSQFFVTQSPQPHLDGGYTVFGRVLEGMDVVDRIARGDVIERVEIIEPK